MANTEIKLKAAGAGVRLWEIAEKLGINDGNFSRKLRHELPDDMKQRVLSIIDEIRSKKEAS
ncbi:MAG: hypothetical protein IJ906_07320 [Oscillospiraceae bacterium]|nr:hypothetical protein [Oscillospiraceae bacterium]